MAPSEHRAAVLGKPVEHSLSPVLHNAGYAALGLSGWSYSRVECSAEELPGLVAELGPEWAGLSVTMPGKLAALAFASETTERASLVGAANTLVPLPSGGWRADCTDVDGVADALRFAGGYVPSPGAQALLLGAGGTALAALVALAGMDVSSFALVVRDPARAADALLCAERLGVKASVHGWADVADLVPAADVVVSTVPGGVADSYAAHLAAAPCVLDVIYHPWPTQLAAAVQARGGRIGTGLDMLLHQAFGQFEQFTGRPAPREAMRDALSAATGGTLPLPLA